MGGSFRLRPRILDDFVANVTPRASGVLRFALQGIVDFFFEDSCLVCGECAKSAAEAVDAEGEAAGSLRAILSRPLGIRLAPFEIVNHPVCATCALGFEEAQAIGFLGLVRERCIETASGERFYWDEPGGGGVISRDGPDGAVRVISPFMTNDSVLRLVHLMKYKSFTSLIPLLADCVAAALDRFGFSPTSLNPLLVPVPSDRADVRKRGYAHTSLMAESLSRSLSVPLSSALARVRRTARQSRTDESMRAANVRGAFAADGVAELDVLLVDDLLTSGATAAACSSALVGAGARSVTVLTFARAG